ncbi:MAG: MFS transporter [Armatimonadota bacterium]|nr:MFS transporter [Armatimonadota bacterium]
MDKANKHLLVLLASLFVVSIGFGITLPVLPFYAERLAMAAGASHKTMVIHVGLLTGVFPLMQLLFAPLWGRLSDRVGRRPLLLVGIAGYGLAQLLFGLATSLWLLYGARILGGILASATIPAATAYVADATDDKERGRGMAWLGTAVSLGAVAGPALGGLTTWPNWHIYSRFGHFVINSFSMPFFAAAALTFLTLVVAFKWLPESLPVRSESASRDLVSAHWGQLARTIWPLLSLSVFSQLGQALFMTVFALYAQVKLGYGPAQVGIAFMVCGSVMALFQGLAVGPLSGRVSEMAQLAVGFSLMSVGIVSLLLVRTEPLVFGAVALQALGMAFISPNLSTLTSKRSGSQTGTALGLQNAANNLGQMAGPLVGGALFAWQASAPYLLTSISMFAIGVAIGLHRSARLSTASVAA